MQPLINSPTPPTFSYPKSRSHPKPSIKSVHSAFKPRFPIPSPQSAFTPVKPNLGQLKRKHKVQQASHPQDQISCYKDIQPPPPPELKKPILYRANYYKVKREGKHILWIQKGNSERKLTFSEEVHFNNVLCIHTKVASNVMNIHYIDGTSKKIFRVVQDK